ncbi:hypothetical protein [Burkholderia sp. IMCC1007]|uniref:hypothetical protein n=1 Tax=Burkholderia sp. IMCC1007 TaxID=3004104 RepID=UPI0022B40E62|nr:hypothetical protein [Burkholderia sp. IMCC1007]
MARLGSARLGSARLGSARLALLRNAVFVFRQYFADIARLSFAIEAQTPHFVGYREISPPA